MFLLQTDCRMDILYLAIGHYIGLYIGVPSAAPVFKQRHKPGTACQNLMSVGDCWSMLESIHIIRIQLFIYLS